MVSIGFGLEQGRRGRASVRVGRVGASHMHPIFSSPSSGTTAPLAPSRSGSEARAPANSAHRWIVRAQDRPEQQPGKSGVRHEHDR